MLVDLDQILCLAEDRTVGQDNVVVLDTVALQLAKQPGRRSCAGRRVNVRRHLNGQHSVWHGTRCLGRYDPGGRPLARSEGRRPKNARAHLPLQATWTPSPISGYPPNPPSRWPRGPRLPVGPTD